MEPPRICAHLLCNREAFETHEGALCLECSGFLGDGGNERSVAPGLLCCELCDHEAEDYL